MIIWNNPTPLRSILRNSLWSKLQIRGFALIATICVMVLNAHGANPEPRVIPAVKHWSGGKGKCPLASKIIKTPANDAVLKEQAVLLQDGIRQVTGEIYQVNHLQSEQNSKTTKGQGTIRLKWDRSIKNKEGYKLVIQDDLTLSASSVAGFYYAGRTLIQMMAQDQQSVVRGTIVDQPSYRVRSLMFDVGRKFLPFDQLKDWVRAMSYVKMNELHLHLNDTIAFAPGFRLEMKTLPGLTNKDGFYTQKQMKELQAFAKVRGIHIVPEIDAPAHATAFTTYRPDLIHPKLSSQNLDLTNPETIKLMEKVFDEVCDVFDSKTIHIGTDELRLGGIRDKKEREEMGELFRAYINHFNAYLAKKGRITRIWSGYEHMPGKTKPDPSVVIDMWVTNDAAAKVKEGYHFINSNHGVTYIVPNTNIYGISNSRVYEKWSPNIFSNKKGGVIPKDCPNLLGGKFHIWNDNGYQYAGYSNDEIARLAMPSLLVFAEKLWGKQGSKTFKEFQQRAAIVLPGNDGFEFTSHSKGRHDPKNPMLGSFPGTSFLQRNVSSGPKGLVWKLKKSTPFVENTSFPLNLKGSPDHLTYPWTAFFEVTRYSDSKIGWMKAPHGHEILMSSRLATLYLDYTYFDQYDKKTQLPTVRNQGLCLVRAARSPAPTPEQHLNREVVYFGYKVPVGKKVTLTLVGQKEFTELYVDGKLMKRVNQQCVCPLQSVGDPSWGGSFHGLLHKASIYNKVMELH